MRAAAAKVKWLLLADIHFKHQDLDRIAQTAAWISSVARQHRVRRVVVCGDLLTSRSSQPTHVLSACYRFLDSLVHDADTHVAHVHVVLGNHDLAYRRDYATTALDALRLASPVVQVHRDVAAHEWDGRRVLTLPFREDQSELADAVAALAPSHAAETVAFAHLAIHRAVTQRHVVRPSSDPASRRTGAVRYHGLMGPGRFSSLARTFTGHFHSHQTILQQQQPPDTPPASPDELLRGSVTYLGSPLQLTWADLWDEQRGVVLLDPETLDHELIANPHAVGYTTVGVKEVLGDAFDPAVIRDKHVMLLGELTRFRYAVARDKLIALGARSVRSWSPMAPRFQSTVALQGLGSSAPASDASLQQQPRNEPDADVDDVPSTADGNAISPPQENPLVLASSPPQPQQVDIREQVERYVEALELDESLEKSRGLLVQVGRRLLDAARSEQADEESQRLGGGQPEILGYRSIIPPHDTDQTGPAASEVGTTAKADLASVTVFNALPRSLTVTNFLGIQSPLHLNFGTDIKRGLTFVVGENGSGKSTLVEAMVWCQFGRCLRSGLGANDVVNDKEKRNCSVRLEFDNGYAITRFRKHKEYGNRIIVERDGNVLPEFEKPDARSTQAAIDELLGVGYDTFVRTIVLGHESATSFLSSTPTQRRDLILSVLGLEILDRCATTTRRLLRESGDDMSELQFRIHGMEQTMDHVQRHIVQLTGTKKRLEADFRQSDLQASKVLKDLEAARDRGGRDIASQSVWLDEQVSAAQQHVDAMLDYNRLADIRRAFEEAKSATQHRRLAALRHLTELEAKHLRLLSTKPAEEPEKQPPAMSSWLLGVVTKTHDRLQSVDVGLDSSSEHESSSLTPEKRAARHAVRALLTFLGRVSVVLGRFPGVKAEKEAKARKEQELHAYRVSLEDAGEKVTEQRQQLSRLDGLASESGIIQQVASHRDTPERDVQDTLEKVSADDAKDASTQLNAALGALAHAQGQRALHSSKQARLVKLQAGARAISEKIATYAQIMERESAARRTLETDRDTLQKDMAALADDRALLDFWSAALAQKSRRVSSSLNSTSSSSSSSSSSAAAAYSTFREFVLEQSLAELNTVTTQILAILFEDSRHATALTTGMLRHLFLGDKSPADYDDDDDEGQEEQERETRDGAGAAAVALDSSLSVDAGLSYGKRSGGERKRIDLALFFALLHVGQSARSRHRAHYMLVDEVFDSLDAAGRAAVVRWCDFMAAAARVAHVVIITHSEDLVSRGVNAAGDGEPGSGAAGGGAVLAARMGEAGVELEMDGRRLGQIDPS